MAIFRPRAVSMLFAATLGTSVLLTAGVAHAEPADQAPIGGAGAHTHHVHTGNGGCVEIDSVAFEPASRGLHRGASEGEPHHGDCATGQH